MSSYGLQTSARGAIGQSLKIDQISNNIANVNTPGFRRDLIAFGSRLADALAGAPVVETVASERAAGGIEATGRPLDLAVAGEGWFAVKELATGATSYTRAGNFKINGVGQLTTQDGQHQVLADDGRGIALDAAGTGDVRVGKDGLLTQGDVEIGRLGITGFEDESRLRKIGDTLFRNEGSGTAAPAAARVEQGALERSGVNPVLEMVELIKSFRVLETNLEMVRLQDAALDRAVNDFGRNR